VHSAVNAVLFDLDNTLADRDWAFRAWASWFALKDLDLVDQQEVDEAVAELIELDADGRTPKDVLFSTLKDRYPHLTEDVNALSAAFRQQLLGHLPPLEDGAARLIVALDAAGILWGIVTNGSANQLRKVEKLDLVDRAACIVVSESVDARKPDPAIFHAAAARIGVAPARILVVGDHPEADIAGAARAGMQTVWLRRGREWPAHVATVPDVIVDALDELLWLANPKRREVADIDSEHFWQQADALVASSEIGIERPQGSAHPQYPDVRYPVDYGSLGQTMASDGSGIDVWVGTLPERCVTGAIMTIDALKRDAEVKLLISCTRQEAEHALAWHDQGRQAGVLLWRGVVTRPPDGSGMPKDKDVGSR
jgi:putative hydrolase of the HAD superfamily